MTKGTYSRNVKNTQSGSDEQKSQEKGRVGKRRDATLHDAKRHVATRHVAPHSQKLQTGIDLKSFMLNDVSMLGSEQMERITQLNVSVEKSLQLLEKVNDNAVLAQNYPFRSKDKLKETLQALQKEHDRTKVLLQEVESMKDLPSGFHKILSVHCEEIQLHNKKLETHTLQYQTVLLGAEVYVATSVFVEEVEHHNRDSKTLAEGYAALKRVEAVKAEYSGLPSELLNVCDEVTKVLQNQINLMNSAFKKDLEVKKELFERALAQFKKQVTVLESKNQNTIYKGKYKDVSEQASELYEELKNYGDDYFSKTTTLENFEERYATFQKKCTAAVEDRSRLGKFEEHRFMTAHTAKILNVILACATLGILSLLASAVKRQWTSGFFNTGKTGTQEQVEAIQHNVGLVR